MNHELAVVEAILTGEEKRLTLRLIIMVEGELAIANE